MAADQQDAPAWHAMSVDDVLGRLQADRGGLSDQEASRWREAYGPNRITPREQASAWRRLARQFANTLVAVLAGAALVMLLIGQWLDAAVVGAVVVINALIGFFQEGRAEQALEAVRKAVSPHASVRRSPLARSWPSSPSSALRIWPTWPRRRGPRSEACRAPFLPASA